jgi:hypothetical protein
LENKSLAICLRVLCNRETTLRCEHCNGAYCEHHSSIIGGAVVKGNTIKNDVKIARKRLCDECHHGDISQEELRSTDNIDENISTDLIDEFGIILNRSGTTSENEVINNAIQYNIEELKDLITYYINDRTSYVHRALKQQQLGVSRTSAKRARVNPVRRTFK